MDTYKTHALNRIIGSLSSRLDSSEIKEGSFLYRLAEAIKAESDISVTQTLSSLKNIHIETCDTKNIQYFGNDLGLSKILIPYMTVISGDNVAYIETPDGSNFPVFLDGLIVLKSGEKIQQGKISIIANEDFVISSNTNRVYVSCTMTSSDNYTFGSSSEIKIGLSNDYMKYVSFRVSQDITFTVVNESDNIFKNRIILERQSEGKRTPDFIRSYIESIQGIHRVYLDVDSKVLYYTTSDMFEYQDESTSEMLGRIIKSELGRILVWPSYYDVKKCDKADLFLSVHVNGPRVYGQVQLAESILAIIKTLLLISNNPSKDRIETMIRIETNESVSITDMYVIDSVTGAKMYDWSSAKDLYVALSLNNITEE